MIDFPLSAEQPLGKTLRSEGICTYEAACTWVQSLPYEPVEATAVSDLFREGAGTCSLKHAFLAELALEHHHPEVELMVGIFRLTPALFPVVESVLAEEEMTEVPETHAFLRIGSDRFDFSHPRFPFQAIERVFVREQRCDPHQVFDWKPMIHKHYIGGWKNRTQASKTEEEIWQVRLRCQATMVASLRPTAGSFE